MPPASGRVRGHAIELIGNPFFRVGHVVPIGLAGVRVCRNHSQVCDADTTTMDLSPQDGKKFALRKAPCVCWLMATRACRW